METHSAYSFLAFLATAASAAALVIHLLRGAKLQIFRYFKISPRMHLFFTVAYALTTAVSLATWVCHAQGWDSHWFISVTLTLVLVLLIVELVLIIARRVNTQACAQVQSVLVVAAHPDDLEIAAGGTLAKLVDRGHQVHAVIMCHGAQGGDASVRPDEARAGSSFLGLASVTIHDLEDRHLEEHSATMVDYIEEAIATHAPDVIITHSRHEVHQDHAAVHHAVMRAARNHHSILCMESPSVTSDFTPTVFVETTEYADVKKAAIAAHANQSDKPYMSDHVVDGITHFRGRQSRLDKAEAFEVMRLRLSNVMPL